MTISFNQNEVQTIAQSFLDAADNLNTTKADISNLEEDFRHGVPNGVWDINITREAEAIANEAMQIIDELTAEITNLQTGFDTLSAAVMTFLEENSNLEADVIDAIKAPMPSDADALDTLDPLGKDEK